MLTLLPHSLHSKHSFFFFSFANVISQLVCFKRLIILTEYPQNVLSVILRKEKEVSCILRELIKLIPRTGHISSVFWHSFVAIREAQQMLVLQQSGHGAAWRVVQLERCTETPLIMQPQWWWWWALAHRSQPGEVSWITHEHNLSLS